MPDLGTYANEVLSAYGMSILLLFGIVGISFQRAKSAKRDLESIERNG